MTSEDANLFEIHRLGGIPIIISLLNDQQNDKRIVKNVLGILLNLATLDKCRNEIKSGISMIFKVLENHSSELAIIEYGIGALVNLCEDNDASIRKEMVNQENSIKVFSEILKDAKFTEEMKRNVLSLISFLSLEPTFITKIVKASSNSTTTSSTSATTGKYMAQKLQNSANDQSLLRILVKQIDLTQLEQIRSKTVFCVYNLIVSDDESGSIQKLLVKEGFVEKMVSVLENPNSENNE
ncbi:predicted protein [Naegleria gruberi]|uniref:Predicted protein n=1 Tax=Naegleria gruberi TaxID=5762 RepID=D2VV23_NAEGR|nr:uncharacterized protein NAEGRDRAFT_72865 [Naegleria gruberi]EFC39420.1 predicted protein [Naegleria gruberi]|eukprot:XP_002672164.1 predicted protein [Naegleria gruberi strain NEG-M]